MGSQISIHNNTGRPINVSLKICHVVWHYENDLSPNESIVLKCGAVWFSVEAVTSDFTNSYTESDRSVRFALTMGGVMAGVAMVIALIQCGGLGAALTGSVGAGILAQINDRDGNLHQFINQLSNRWRNLSSDERAALMEMAKTVANLAAEAARSKKKKAKMHCIYAGHRPRLNVNENEHGDLVIEYRSAQ